MKSLAVALLAVTFSAAAHAQSCVVSFSDTLGLQILDPSMAYGFMAPGGGIVWYYNQCGGPSSDNWLYFDEKPPGGYPAGSSYGHFHIPYSDPTINCYTTTAAYPSGMSGRQPTLGSACTAIDNPFNKHRSLLPHHSDGVLRFRYLPHTGEPSRYITPTHIRVIGSVPVSVLFQASDGSWWVWDDLTEGEWTLVGGLPATQAFVLSDAPRFGPVWEVTDLGITLGAYYTPPVIRPGLCILCRENQFTTVRDFLSSLSLEKLRAAQASQQDAPLVDSVALAGRSPSKPPKSLTNTQVREIWQRHATENGEEAPDDPGEILAQIATSSGTERQVLIGEYLLAISHLPQPLQLAAQQQLVALFEPKR